jgi:hypothetical protein
MGTRITHGCINVDTNSVVLKCQNVWWQLYATMHYTLLLINWEGSTILSRENLKAVITYMKAI